MAVYVSGEAHADTKALVDAFLAWIAFAQVPTRAPAFSKPAPGRHCHPNTQYLARIRRRLWGPAWILQLAMVFSMLAFGRIVSDTSWDVSPRNFIVMASMAAAFWIAFVVILIRNRARILIQTPGRRTLTRS